MKVPSWKKEILYPKSLQQRTIVFVLVPIFIFLTIAGVFGYRAVRNILLEQWSEAALAKLEKSAFDIDSQLQRPKQVLLLLEGITEKVLIEGSSVRLEICKRTFSSFSLLCSRFSFFF